MEICHVNASVTHKNTDSQAHTHSDSTMTKTGGISNWQRMHSLNLFTDLLRLLGEKNYISNVQTI